MTGYVIALMGLPGSGKSTVAAYLCSHLPLVEVNRDTIRAAMFPQCRYSDAENAAAVAAAFNAVDINCTAELNSLVDGMTFADGHRRDELRALCGRHDYRWVPLWLDCPVAVARRRVGADHTHQTHVAQDRVPDLVDTVASRFEFPDSDVLRLDATQPVSSVCLQAYNEVQSQIAPA